MSVYGDKSDDEYSVIGDRGEMGFIDYGDEKSVCSYNPREEGPVVISVPFQSVHHKPQSVTVDEISSSIITLENTTSESIDLWKIHIYASNPEDCFTLSLTDPSKPGFVGLSSLDDRVLQPHKTLTVWLCCKPKEIGMHTCYVHFDVGDDMIERVVFVLAEDSISKALASKKPYQRARRKSQFRVESYVNGVRPAAKPSYRGYRPRLSKYEIPNEIREIIQKKGVPDAILEGLTKKNYVNYFTTLLIMEELRLEEDIRAYDMEGVTMKSRGRQFLVLEVLGLAERRPSLVHGDSVFARVGEGPSVYEGCIHRVEADQVYLKFADEFHHRHHDQNYYNISFMYDRVNLRRLYHATESAEKLHVDFLFPSEASVKRHIKPAPVAPISGNLNEEQLNAVRMILGCRGGVPYIINGPPGTGKTMTLVEVVLQLYATRKFSKILICAASNSAADHILEKILKQKSIRLREDDIFRLNAVSRPYEEMNPDHLQFCYTEDDLFRCPPIKALLRYRIVITTYMSSSHLYAEGVRRGTFSHIILDEAGQASEPETMVPISNLCEKGTVIVLAGDPKQLGPVIFSPDAKTYGLAKSYLERLFECELYSEGDEGYVTTLQRNYRSHCDILQLPSELFYCGQLIACHESLESLPWADLLPNKEFPILFSGVQAYDEREGDNPSWFNRTEASMVVKLIKKLIERSVSEDSIGVITPYRQQVAKIRTALDDVGILNVKIGSVEQFQGQEREVIIISTVRSTIKHDEFDKKHYLGFLSNPKRFNVAITRARSLLVIIGNPHIICKDRNWEKLLWRCVDNNSYEGCSLPERSSPIEEKWTDQEIGDWSGAAAQETQWEWSNTADGGPDWEWSNSAEQAAGGEWSNSVEQVAGGEWSNSVEQAAGGEWSNSAEQVAGGEWSNSAEQVAVGEWSNSAEQAAGGEWSNSAEQAAGGEWSNSVEQVAGGQWSNSVDQGRGGEWSNSVDQGRGGEWSNSVDQGRGGEWSNSVVQAAGGDWSSSVDQGRRGEWSNSLDQGPEGEWSNSVEQGPEEGWSNSVEQGLEGGWSNSVEQGAEGGWSGAPEQENQWGLSDAPDQGQLGWLPGTPDQMAQGEWSEGPGQALEKDWSEDPNEVVKGEWSENPDQSVNGGGPDIPDQAINGERPEGPDEEGKGGYSAPDQAKEDCSDGSDEMVKEGLSSGSDQVVEEGRSDVSYQAEKSERPDCPDLARNEGCSDDLDRAGKGEYTDVPDEAVKEGLSDGLVEVVKEGLSDGPVEMVKEGLADGAYQETQCCGPDPVKQGTQGGQSSSPKRKVNRGRADGPVRLVGKQGSSGSEKSVNGRRSDHGKQEIKGSNGSGQKTQSGCSGTKGASKGRPPHTSRRASNECSLQKYFPKPSKNKDDLPERWK